MGVTNLEERGKLVSTFQDGILTRAIGGAIGALGAVGSSVGNFVVNNIGQNNSDVIKILGEIDLEEEYGEILARFTLDQMGSMSNTKLRRLGIDNIRDRNDILH